ncbi:MAG: putative metal-binding motif-containing protein [Planctomycetota bacterium]
MQPGVDGYGNAGPIVLEPVPRSFILGSWHDPVTFDLTLELSATGDPGAYLGDTGAACDCGALGYKVLAQIVPRNSTPPSDRDVGSGWFEPELPGGVPQVIVPMGSPVTVDVLCGAYNTDVYVATRLYFDSGYSTSVVSRNSTRVKCGPGIPVDLDGDGVFAPPEGNDCDDGRIAVFPGAPQVCDGVNNDCDDPAWPALPPAETDDDGDAWSECDGDCDDTLGLVHPNASETCNAVDDDCDGLTDEDEDGEDTDGDGTANLCDNCPTTHHLDQADIDADQEGDVCDLDDGYDLLWFSVPQYVEWHDELYQGAWNVYRGDLAVLETTGIYTQTPGSNDLAGRFCDLAEPWVYDPIVPDAGEVAFYLVNAMEGDGETSLGPEYGDVPRPGTDLCTGPPPGPS